MKPDVDINISQNLIKLRNDFDRIFTVPVQNETVELVNLLVIQFGDNYFALRANEISGLFRNKRVVPIPNNDVGFLGVSGIQGQSVPVYSLATCLGFDETSVEQVRWLIISGEKNKVGWAFDELKGYVSLPCTALFVPNETKQLREHVSGAVRLDSRVGYVLSVSSMLNSIKKNMGITGENKGE